MTRCLSLATIVAAFSLAVVAPAGATVIHADVKTDLVASADGHCSLREAVEVANTNQVFGPGFGECPPGTPDNVGPDTIVLDAGTYILHSDDANVGQETTLEDDLNVKGNTTIEGQGPAATTIKVEVQDRAIHAEASAHDVTISGLRITAGRALTGDFGGGVFAEGANLTLSNCAFDDNRAGANGGGGGAVTAFLTGQFVVDGCSFHDNHAGNGGQGSDVASGSGPGGSGGDGGVGGALDIGFLNKATITNSTFDA